MKTKMTSHIAFTVLVALTCLFNLPPRVLAQGTVFSYAGELTDAGAPANGSYVFQFTLYGIVAGTETAIAGPLAPVTKTVVNGAFTVTLDFGDVFDGSDRWLGIEVHTNNNTAMFTALTPHVPILPTPYAITAKNVSGNVTAAQVNGTFNTASLADEAVTTPKLAPLAVTTAKIGDDQVTTAKIPDDAITTPKIMNGQVTAAKLSAATPVPGQVLTYNLPGLTWTTPSSGWGLLGNTTVSGNFLGTLNNQPLEVRANNLTVLRMVPSSAPGSPTPNVIGGAANNSIPATVYGSVLFGGGGLFGNPNSISANESFIGGGQNNTIGSGANDSGIMGGAGNVIGSSSTYAAISGGQGNNVSASSGFIGGGIGNQVNGAGSAVLGGSVNIVASGAGNSAIAGGNLNSVGSVYSIIGGGYQNKILAGANGSSLGGGNLNEIGANAFYSTISGGDLNKILTGADHATIPGGDQNQAGGKSSFAAGAKAYATNNNSFVWNDSSSTAFSSTAANQFLVHAANGVGINTNNPHSALEVNGTVTATYFVGDGSGLTGVGGGGATATSENIPDTIVKRDGTGSFAAGSLTVNGSFNLAAPTIYAGGVLILNADSFANFFTGPFAGNDTMEGMFNTGFGLGALQINSAGEGNTANGFVALNSNETGNSNTACGAYALFSNSSGSNNTANGAAALYSNSTGFSNTASGFQALYLNNTGYGNTANGAQALYNNRVGFWNSAQGLEALFWNEGDGNTANGAFALHDNTSGTVNTASGTGALISNLTGSRNTANGASALALNTYGGDNTAVGEEALFNTGGSGNIALGSRAGYSLTGNNNIAIGNEGLSGQNGTIRIGTGGTHSSTFIAGIHDATVASGVPVVVDASGQLGVTTSSARFKDNIQSMDDASSALYSLRPVTFNYKPELDPEALPQFGLVAEEVEKVDPDLVARDDKNQIYTVRYEAVNAMLLNEFLKQHKTVEEQKTEIQTLKERLEKLEQLMGQRNGGAK